jgi:hypothetical protein
MPLPEENLHHVNPHPRNPGKGDHTAIQRALLPNHLSILLLKKVLKLPGENGLPGGMKYALAGNSGKFFHKNIPEDVPSSSGDVSPHNPQGELFHDIPQQAGAGKVMGREGVFSSKPLGSLLFGRGAQLLPFFRNLGGTLCHSSGGTLLSTDTRHISRHDLPSPVKAPLPSIIPLLGIFS